MLFSEDGRPLPQPTPTTQPFFDAAREGRLVLQRCARDGFFYYPRSNCPKCLGRDWKWEAVSGRGRVHAFTIDRIGHDPAQRARVPLAIAVIELDEGPRMTANLVGCAPESIRVGQAVEACFERIGDAALVQFRPTS